MGDYHRCVVKNDQPDPEELEVRWIMLGVPPQVIKKHVAALAQQAPRSSVTDDESIAKTVAVRSEGANVR